MPVRSVVGAEDVHRPQDLHAGRVDRHEDLRLLLVGVRIGIGADHRDHDLAARVARTRDVELLSVDQPLVAVEHGVGLHLLGIRAHHRWLGHGVGRADLAFEQRFQPFRLLLRRADTLEHFHVAGVGRGAVEALRGQPVLAQLVGDIGVVEIAQSFAGVRVGQEEVPQALLTCLGLGAVQQLELAGCPAPAVFAVLAHPVEFLGDGVDLVADERLDRFVQRLDLGGHPKIEIVHARGLQCSANHSCSPRVLASRRSAAGAVNPTEIGPAAPGCGLSRAPPIP